MISVIAEHSVDLDLLPSDANVLDIGCRGFEFSDHIAGLERNIWSVDIDDLQEKYKWYLRLAISNKNGVCGVNHTQDKQATNIKDGNEIPMMTIEMFSKMVGVKEWDLIKLDIEGEEYNVLKHAKRPIAKQVSVEFHAHCGKYIKQDYDELLGVLSQYYDIHNKVWESRHGAGFNYWDVLLIAK